MNQPQFENTIEILQTLPDALGSIMVDNDHQPFTNSQASLEQKEIDYPDLITTGYRQGYWGIEFAADHMSLLKRALTEPLMTFSPWTLARIILESSSTGYWLLDTSIDGHERVSRSFSLRLQELREQATFGRDAIAQEINTSSHFQDASLVIDKRIEHLKDRATSLGIRHKLDRRNRLIGFGDGMPGATDLARSAFNDSLDYRLLSGLTHGRFWANISLALRKVDGRSKLEQDMTLTRALYIVTSVIHWFSKTTWEYFKLFGWNLKQAVAILERLYDQAKFTTETRFWRKDYLDIVRPVHEPS
ncbi:MAG: hypothetical protein BZY79_06190 [SAR202 cluster bacterium Casp-Chloro-G4]|nr:hypothetical protein [Chloroflexota bacterium]MDA1227677.1 hypothetical protein [Chloroflexota bacterium]PKB60979.1 MAG: hypothetical protein BZY79_06190 [SAR202 cluster bacterium Casp-Chloro-G4]